MANEHTTMDDKEFFFNENLEVSIHKTEILNFNDGLGATIYVSVRNKAAKAINVKIEDVNIINIDKEQRSFDCNYSGFSQTECQLLPDAYFLHGYIFYESNCGSLEVGWIFKVLVGDKTDGAEYEILFRLSKMNPFVWEIIECKIVHPDDERNRLKQCVEQIPVFEDKLNVRIENINFKLNGEYFVIFYELFTNDGADLSESICVTVVCYDKDNSILCKRQQIFSNESFMGFDTVEQIIPLESKFVEKIRVYPSKM